MPFVHLKLFGAKPGQRDISALQQGLTALMKSPMRKKPELTVVAVEQSSAHVALGGEQLADDQWTAQITALVTAGTNTEEEKAVFQSAAHELLAERFGAPSAPVYVVVLEVPGGDWGYGGRSQAARAKAALPG